MLKHDRFLDLADWWSRFATCPRLSVGAVIVDAGGSVRASGYNGAPRGVDDCRKVGCSIVDNHCLKAVHAELNAVIQGARTGVNLSGTTMFTRYHPCVRCALAIIQAGIKRVIYREEYGNAVNELSRDLMEQGGVEVERHAG